MSTTQILLFAGLRERCRASSLQVTLPPDATAADVKTVVARAHPELAGLLGPCRVAADQEFVSEDERVNPNAELALIPPVSGGHDGAQPTIEAPPTIYVGSEALRPEQVIAAVSHAGAGGLVSFCGAVREWSRGEQISHLDYEAYVPMACKVIGNIISAIESDIEGSRVAIHHRLGRLGIGDIAVVIAASAPHRAEAFAACREAIEALKRDVPIWKREHGVTGAVWIGQGP